jgi:D-alanyl-D-alanine dipeptidase
MPFDLFELMNRSILPVEHRANWSPVVTRECGEPLVPMTSILSPSIRCHPQYRIRGVPHSLDCCYCRQGVAGKLVQISDWLSGSNLALVIWDAWRPFAVQQALYEAYKAQLRRQYPDASEDELDMRTRKFVALPSRDPARPSPHLTGGALDVTLGDAEGNELPMGTGFDDFSEPAMTCHYETLQAQRPLSDQELGFLRNRRLLVHLMSQAGFTNYEEEWWHYDLGNRRWAALTCQTAVYGPIELA